LTSKAARKHAAAAEGEADRDELRRVEAPRARQRFEPRRSLTIRHGSSRHRNAVIDLFNAAGRIMGDLARDLKRIFGPRQSSLERYFEHLCIEGEAAEREAKQAAHELAERDQELQEWLELQRRRLEDELEANRARSRRASPTAELTAFHLAAISVASRSQPLASKRHTTRRKGRGRRRLHKPRR
jgi:hypothetical protein